MRGFVFHWRIALLWTCCVSIAALAAPTATAQIKYDPDHPEVEKMVRQSLKALEAMGAPNGMGPRTLGALTVVECSKRYDDVVPVNHPLVSRVVNEIVEDVRSGALRSDESTYLPAIALILLCDAGDEKYKNEIAEIISFLIERQNPDGSYTYQASQGVGEGDTSQTQYASLALWVAQKHGFKIPLEVPRKALDWLVKANLPNGGWVYHYVNLRPKQQRPTLSIHAASLGTVYLLSDFLQLNPRVKKRKSNGAFLDQVKDGTRLPPSISVYVPPKETSATGDKTATGEALAMKSDGSALVSFNTSGLASAKRKGNDYLYDNFQIDDTYWGYYYLYALERYAFFRERAEGSVRQIPDWYDQGVEYLQTRQMKNGAFPKIRFESQYIATCFASLFLVRSSEVLVLPGNKGGLSGGESLRSNVRLDLVNGKIKTFDVIKGMDDVMQLLDGDEIDEKQYELILDSLTRSVNNLSGNTRRSPREQLAYLRGLVSDRNYFKRRIAVKLLSRQQEMDNVPALIYALGDPDLRICQEAHNGLRLISRKLDSIPITDEPTYAEYQNIKKQWTEWFLKIRPGAELLD